MKSNFLTVFVSLLFVTFCACNKKPIEVKTPQQIDVPSENVTVVFSTLNSYNEATDWYLYQIQDNGDTLENFGTVQSPIWLRIYYSPFSQDGSYPNYAKLNLCTEKVFTFGVHDIYKNVYKPVQTFVFHAKDTVKNGIISQKINY